MEDIKETETWAVLSGTENNHPRGLLVAEERKCQQMTNWRVLGKCIDADEVNNMR